MSSRDQSYRRRLSEKGGPDTLIADGKTFSGICVLGHDAIMGESEAHRWREILKPLNGQIVLQDPLDKIYTKECDAPDDLKDPVYMWLTMVESVAGPLFPKAHRSLYIRNEKKNTFPHGHRHPPSMLTALHAPLGPPTWFCLDDEHDRHRSTGTIIVTNQLHGGPQGKDACRPRLLLVARWY